MYNDDLLKLVTYTKELIDLNIKYAEEIERLNNIIKEAIELLYTWGETLNPEFQKK